MTIPDYNLDPPEDGPDFDDMDGEDLTDLIRYLESATEDADVPRRKRHAAEAVLQAARDTLRYRTE